MDKVNYSFVIPCYNSEKTIGFIVEQIINAVQKYNLGKYEIILVNDASTDNTWNVIYSLAAQNSSITAINFSKNFGQHSAIISAFRESSREYIVGLDDDGEHSPDDVMILISEIKKSGYDYVCGKYKKKKDSAFRNLGTKFNNLMASILIGKPKEVEFSSYYIMRRFLVDEIIKYNGPYPYIAGLVLRATKKVGMVEMPKHERISGSSGYNLVKLLRLWLNGFTAFSVKPLRIATVLGILCAFIGFVFGAITIIRKIMNPDILMGYSSLMAVLLFIGGMIMVMLGMVGEYIGRIYICINNSPQYVIRETISIKQNDEEKAYEKN